MNSFTIVYVCFQAVVLLVVLGILWRKKGWYAHTNTAASILTIVGVLGTFIGIFIGLQEFTISDNSKEMQNSISELLDGLKLAFLTSIIGIGSALFLKGAISPIAKHFQNEINPDKVAMDMFVNSLQNVLAPLVTSGEVNLSSKFDDLTETIKGEGAETRKVLDSIKTELTNGQKEQGEQTRKTLTDIQSEIIKGQSVTNTHLQSLTETVNGESIETRKVLDSMKTELTSEQEEQGEQTRKTLTDIQSAFTEKQNKTFIQLRTLTKTVSYEHNQLRKEFDAFSNNVAESITKLATNELITALTDVIGKFNAKITEQFGDNFKQLNEAVGKTVEWQEQYRQQMDQLASEFRIAAESIEQSRESIISIAESSHQIAIRSESIVSSSEKLDPILHTLNGQLETFDKMSNNVQNAMPIIEQSINELTRGFSETVKKAISDSNASMEGQREAFEEQYTSLQISIDETSKQVSEMTSQFSETVQTSISKSNKNLDDQRQAFMGVQTELGKALGDSTTQFKEIVNGIKEQIDQVFKESAEQIVASTSEFTENLSKQLEKPLGDFSDNFSKNVNKSIENSQTSVNQQLDALQHQSEQLNSAVINSVNTMQAQVGVLQTGLENALEESLNGLVGQLTSLSNKFAEDYEPLTEKLQQVVEMANNIPDQRTDIPL